jgi:hypothetical protein
VLRSQTFEISLRVQRNTRKSSDEALGITEGAHPSVRCDCLVHPASEVRHVGVHARDVWLGEEFYALHRTTDAQ